MYVGYIDGYGAAVCIHQSYLKVVTLAEWSSYVIIYYDYELMLILVELYKE